MRRGARLERMAAREGLTTRRRLATLADGRTILILSFIQRPVPRRWWHDWRAVTAVSLCALLAVLGCAYAAYRAVVALVAGAVAAFATALPIAGGLLVLVLALGAVKALGGGTFTFSGKGKIN